MVDLARVVVLEEADLAKEAVLEVVASLEVEVLVRAVDLVVEDLAKVAVLAVEVSLAEVDLVEVDLAKVAVLVVVVWAAVAWV
ncbi:MAG: hypothetical protein RL179_965 [Planctomycetota bacterium]